MKPERKTSGAADAVEWIELKHGMQIKRGDEIQAFGTTWKPVKRNMFGCFWTNKYFQVRRPKASPTPSKMR